MKNTQHEKILALLRNAGIQGVSSYEFTFTHGIKQCPTRIHELKKAGHQIVSKPFKNSVIYILLGEAKTIASQVPERYRQPWETPMEKYTGKDGRIYWREIEKTEQGGLWQENA